MLFFDNNKRVAILRRLMVMFERGWFELGSSYQKKKARTIPRIAEEISSMINGTDGEYVNTNYVRTYLYKLRDAGILVKVGECRILRGNGEQEEYVLDKKKALKIAEEEFKQTPQYALLKEHLFYTWD